MSLILINHFLTSDEGRSVGGGLVPTDKEIYIYRGSLKSIMVLRFLFTENLCNQQWCLIAKLLKSLDEIHELY